MGKYAPAYGNALDWVHASFAKVVQKNHSTLSFRWGLIQTSCLWEASDFYANSPGGRQAAEFIQVRFLGHYGAPLAQADTASARVAPTDKAAAHAARDSVGARVVWGDDPRDQLRDAGEDAGARAPPVFTPFGQAAVRACALVSGSSWRGSSDDGKEQSQHQSLWFTLPGRCGRNRAQLGQRGGKHQRERWEKWWRRNPSG